MMVIRAFDWRMFAAIAILFADGSRVAERSRHPQKGYFAMRPTNGTHELSDGPSAQVTSMNTRKALDARNGPGPSLASFDLNLLIAFEALWVERSVTAAGRRLGLSQPATSATLARLRVMLGDRLFVRGKSGLQPTERCAELAAPISKTLVELRNTLAGSSFDPSTTTRQIRIGAVDAAIAVWMPRLLARTMREAPSARVQVISDKGHAASAGTRILGSYLAVPPVLARTDAWAVLPRPYAEALAKDGALAMLPLLRSPGARCALTGTGSRRYGRER